MVGLVESGTVLFGPGQKVLIDAILAVPADRTQWDLVDAAGLCVRGFPLLQAESMPVDSMDRPNAMARARGYAARVAPTRQASSQPSRWPGAGRTAPMAQARSYAPHLARGSNGPLR